MNATILLADDDRARRAALERDLVTDGYDVLSAPTLATANHFLAGGSVDLALLARDLNGDDGLALLRNIRAAGEGPTALDAELPVLVLSEQDSEFERLRCFELGADDLLAAPYGYPELRARIAALLRRYRRGCVPRRMRVGPLEIDTLGRRAWVYHQPIDLSRKEFSLLRTLATNPGRVFARDELMARVWGWDDPYQARSSRTLDSHASRLRHKLAVNGADFVVNVWGVGYKLTELFEPPTQLSEPEAERFEPPSELIAA